MKKFIMMLLAVSCIGGFSAMAQRTTPGNNNKMYQPQTFTDFAFEGILLEPAQQARIDSLNQAVNGRPFAKATPGKDCKKADCKKADCKKADCKKADCKKADCKKADCKKADCKKADCKKGDCKKADCKKAKGQKQQCVKDSCFAAAPEMVEFQNGKCKVTECKKGQRPQIKVCDDYVMKVQEILTPDQFAVFTENISNMPMMKKCGKASAQKCDKGTKVKDGKDSKKGKRQMKGDAKQCPKAGDCKAKQGK